MKIFIAGHKGMVGSAVLRNLTESGYKNLLTFSSAEFDLCNQSNVDSLLADNKPDVVIIAAAKVGGILANNTYRAEFIYNNMVIEIQNLDLTTIVVFLKGE